MEEIRKKRYQFNYTNFAARVISLAMSFSQNPSILGPVYPSSLVTKLELSSCINKHDKKSKII